MIRYWLVQRSLMPKRMEVWSHSLVERALNRSSKDLLFKMVRAMMKTPMIMVHTILMVAVFIVKVVILLLGTVSYKIILQMKAAVVEYSVIMHLQNFMDVVLMVMRRMMLEAVYTLELTLALSSTTVPFLKIQQNLEPVAI